MGLFRKKKEISKANYELYHTLLSLNGAILECRDTIYELSKAVMRLTNPEVSKGGKESAREYVEAAKKKISDITKNAEDAAVHIVAFYKYKTHTDKEDEDLYLS